MGADYPAALVQNPTAACTQGARTSPRPCRSPGPGSPGSGPSQPPPGCIESTQPAPMQWRPTVMVDQHNTKKPAKAPKGGGAQPGAAAKQGGGGRQAGTKQGAAAKGKLAKGAAARREAERRRRQRTLAWTAGVVVVVLALVGLILYQGRDTSTKLTRPSAAALATAMKAAGCGDVKQFPQAGRNHIAPDKQPSNWNSNPPTSGDHLGTPLPRGIYADQQDERAAVHNLEHGYVVIQYKNLPG